MPDFKNYDLKIIKNDSECSDRYLIKEVLNRYWGFEHTIDENGDCYESSKLADYEYEEDLKEFSKLAHKVVFRLKIFPVVGETAEVKYFMNGKMQKGKGKFVFDDFDEQKLK